MQQCICKHPAKKTDAEDHVRDASAWLDRRPAVSTTASIIPSCSLYMYTIRKPQSLILASKAPKLRISGILDRGPFASSIGFTRFLLRPTCTFSDNNPACRPRCNTWGDMKDLYPNQLAIPERIIDDRLIAHVHSCTASLMVSYIWPRTEDFPGPEVTLIVWARCSVGQTHSDASCPHWASAFRPTGILFRSMREHGFSIVVA